MLSCSVCFFFFNDTATTEIYTLSLHDALPICARAGPADGPEGALAGRAEADHLAPAVRRNGTAKGRAVGGGAVEIDRKSTRLNSSHDQISYAVFCLKKKNAHARRPTRGIARPQ